MSAKTEVIEMVKNLPEDVTLEDIQYHLYVREKIAQSIESVKAGKTYTHEEVKAMIVSWQR